MPQRSKTLRFFSWPSFFAHLLLIVSVALGVYLAFNITKPLYYMSSVAKEISLGNLDQKIEVDSKDELVKELLSAYERMQNTVQIAMKTLEEQERKD